MVSKEELSCRINYSLKPLCDPLQLSNLQASIFSKVRNPFLVYGNGWTFTFSHYDYCSDFGQLPCLILWLSLSDTIFFFFFFSGGGAGWKGRAIAMEVNPSPTKCQHSRWNEKQKQRSPDQIKERHSANSDPSTTNLSDNTTNCRSEKRGMKHRHTKPCTHTHTKKTPKSSGNHGNQHQQQTKGL